MSDLEIHVRGVWLVGMRFELVLEKSIQIGTPAY